MKVFMTNVMKRKKEGGKTFFKSFILFNIFYIFIVFNK